MPNIFEKIHAKIELYRLEKRYTRNRNRRSTFISNAVYVDGEYVFQTPNTTGSSGHSSSTYSSGPVVVDEERTRHSADSAASPPTLVVDPAQKKRNRFSAMPGFGSLAKGHGIDWDIHAVGVSEVR